MALLEAIRALTAFTPPPALPECDLTELVHVLTAHGLAPLASYQVEHTRLGAGLPSSFREALLGQYQGVVNDNVLKLVGLRGTLRAAPEVPVVLLESAAYVDWLYPHMAFRPVGDLRIALRGADGARFAASVKEQLRLDRTEHDGRVAVFTDGRITITAQEGLWPGGPADGPLFERGRPHPAFGPSAARPSAEDALLASVGDQAVSGLLTPLITFVDLRELVRLRLDAAYVRERAAAAGPRARALRLLPAPLALLPRRGGGGGRAAPRALGTGAGGGGAGGGRGARPGPAATSARGRGGGAARGSALRAW